MGRKTDQGDWLFRKQSLIIRAGDRQALIGPSGSGKSLLLRALAMLDPLDEGQILWQGERLHADDIPRYRANVIYLHQRPTLFEESVEENLQRPFLLRSHPTSYNPDRVVSLLKQAGRDASFLQKWAPNLSGGEMQIAALVRALQLDPRVMLLDEPTAALDQETSEAVEQLIQTWWSEDQGQRAYLLVSHNQEQANRLSDRLIRLDKGELITA